MKVLVRSLLFLFLIGIGLVNCSKWKVSPYDLVPVATTVSVTTIGSTSAVVPCQVGELGPNTLQEFGIVYSSQNPNPTISDNKVPAQGTSGSAPVTLTNLLPSTTYYYRTYATNNKNLTGYGDTQKFTTAELFAQVTTLDPVGTPSSTSAQVQCQVTSQGSGGLKEYGIIYSTTNQNILTGTKVAAIGTGGIATVTLNGLQPNVTYYYQAYAVSTASGTPSYGAVKSFKTTPTISVVTLTSRPTQLNDQTTTLTIQVDQPNGVAEYGVVLTTDANQLNQLLAGSLSPIKQPKTSTFPSNGSIDFQVTGLQANTQYYAVAYAKDGSGKTILSKDYSTFQTKDVLNGSWRKLANLPASLALVSNPIFTINSKVYVGTTAPGGQQGYFKQLYEYDPLTNLWIRKKDFPGTGRVEPTVGVLNNKAYVFFGYDNGTTKTYTSDAWEYDPATDIWRQLTTPIPTGSGTTKFNQQKAGIPFVYNGKIGSLFGLGPAANASLTTVYTSEYRLNPIDNGGWDVYDHITDQGLSTSTLYAAARAGAFSFQYGTANGITGTSLYFGGGYAASKYTGAPSTYSSYFATRDIWRYDLLNGGFSKVASLPSSFNDCNSNQDSGSMSNCVFVIGTKAYIIDCSHNTWVMDLTTNAITAVPSLNNPQNSVGIGVSIGTKAYWGLRMTEWYEFTP